MGCSTQYFQYWGQLAHGNLGISITYYPSNVTSVIANALPWTIGLVGMSTIIAFIVGTTIGTLAAWRRGSWLDVALPTTAFLQALPYFWLGLVAIEIFAVKLGWFPISGGYTAGLTPGLGGAFLGDATPACPSRNEPRLFQRPGKIHWHVMEENGRRRVPLGQNAAVMRHLRCPVDEAVAQRLINRDCTVASIQTNWP